MTFTLDASNGAGSHKIGRHLLKSTICLDGSEKSLSQRISRTLHDLSYECNQKCAIRLPGGAGGRQHEYHVTTRNWGMGAKQRVNLQRATRGAAQYKTKDKIQRDSWRSEALLGRDHRSSALSKCRSTCPFFMLSLGKVSRESSYQIPTHGSTESSYQL